MSIEQIISATKKEIAGKLQKALNEAYEIASDTDTRAHNVACAYSYLEARIEQIIEELKEGT